jgi:hypothetical protein
LAVHPQDVMTIGTPVDLGGATSASTSSRAIMMARG